MRVLDFIKMADMSGAKDVHYRRAVQKDAEKAVVLVADNVRAWYYEHVPNQTDRDPTMFERCVPPFRTTCVEFRLNDSPEFSLMYSNVGVLVYRDFDDVADEWSVHFAPCMSDLRTGVKVAEVLLHVPVSRDGKPDWSRATYRSKREEDLLESGIVDMVAVSLLAFRFANAKGVEMVEHTPPRHERRSAIREGRAAPSTFRTLEIKPITKRLEDAGVDTIGLTKALHLCRGHFADYTKGAGLFGKYKVEVFVPEHFKGRRERGVVEKEYTMPHPFT